MSKVFVRDATGLVKQISFFGAFAYNVNSQTVAFAVFQYSLILAFTPGADANLCFFIAMALSIPLLLVYVLFTASMPRSGGEYVYTSRALSPWLGSIAAFTVWWIQILYLGINTSWIGSVDVSPPLVLMGTILHSSTIIAIGNAVATPTWGFVIGSVVIVGVGLTLILGTSVHIRLQNLIFILGTIAAVVMIGVLLSSTHGQFVASFDRYAAPYTNSTDPYNNVLTVARQQGFTTAPFSWYATLVGVTIAAASVNFAYFSAYCSGEMKHASQVSRQAGVMIGSMLFNALLSVAIAGLVVRVAGADFAGAAFYLGNVAPSLWPFSVAPFLNVFIAMLTDNVVLNAIFAMGWMAWGIATTAILFLMLTRLLFAWSFDRLIPSVFANVNERFHTPVNATIFIIVLGEISTYVFLQVAAAYAVFLTFGMTLTWIATAFLFLSIAAIVFPYKCKDIYNSSVAKGFEIGGIPLISIMGAISTGITLMYIYFYLTVSSLGVNTPSILTLDFVPVLAAALLYPAILLIRKKQGIDLKIAFTSIPPE
jgi:amino acid transporter